MNRQSLPWANWIVVDDGTVQTECSLGQHHLSLSSGLPPAESFARSLRAGLHELGEMPETEFVFFIEDDDWYGRNYLASLVVALMKHDLVGESYFRYYNVSEKSYHYCGNAHHAALCATAFRAALIPDVLALVDENDVFLDLRMWRQLKCSKHLQPTSHCVGLKAQVGRPGLAWGHKPNELRPDREGTLLKSWLGRDAPQALEFAIKQ